MCQRPHLFNNILYIFFFFNDTATPEIYPLSLHDALPISSSRNVGRWRSAWRTTSRRSWRTRSGEHTSELQSPDHLVCRLLLDKKNKFILTRMFRNLPSEPLPTFALLLLL